MRYYSKRELYALGETLGDSVTEHKVGGGRVYGGGGKGGGGPTSTKTETSNIPEYARPYVENMLGATQRQLFNITPGTAAKEATYDSEGNMLTPATEATGEQITGFKPYQAYSTNPNDYVAGFSPLQQQAMQGMANMQVAPQVGQGTQFANQAGIGSFGLGNQAAMAGQNYAMQATNPYAMQAYMSPYMQDVVDVQKSAALRDYAKALPGMKAQAVAAGAFGGNRAALQESEAQRGLMSQLQGIQAQGTQQAFQNAQQAQQYGANLGLQGLSTGLQGYGQGLQAASTLGQLGQSQYGQQMGILEGQAKAGALQQQQEQQKINQSIQDWANTQQYPLMQLGVMSNMLRGLPMQGVTTSQYVPQANSLTQGIGTAGALTSLYNATKGNAGGGMVKSMAGGGIASVPGYLGGGVTNEIESKLYDMPADELAKYKEQTTSPMIRKLAERILREETGKAGGGIIAFATGTEDTVGADARAAEGKRLLSDFEERLAEESRAKFNFGSPKAAPPAAAPVVPAAPVESADPALVRQAQVDAANLQSGNTAPKLPTAEQLANPRMRAALAAEARNNAPQVNPASIIAAAPEEAPTAQSRVRGKALTISEMLRPSDSPRMKAARASEEKKPYTLSEAEKQSEADYESARPIPVKPGAAPAAPAVDTKQGPSAGIKSAEPTSVGVKAPDRLLPTAGIKGDLSPVGAMTAGKPTPGEPQDLKSILKETEDYLGPNKAAQEQRANLMAEKASAKDEASRQTSMRMAEFFAAWGSTPGNTIVAGLNALKNKVPDFISDKKDQKRIEREINNNIYELDKADRLEKAGNIKEAQKIRLEQAKIAEQRYGHELTYAASLHRDQATITAAGMRAEGGGGGSEKRYIDAIKNKTKVESDITAEKNKDEYKDALKWANFTVKPDASEIIKNKVANAKATLQKIDSEHKRRLSEATDTVNRYKKDTGLETTETTAAPAAKGDTVTVGDKTYSKLPNMTDAQWAAYKKEMGVK